ncbi:MAG TPA: TolC family protein [Cyclobacteriaceae bacterium]
MTVNVRIIVSLMVLCAGHANAQEVLTMRRALELGVNNYGSIKARSYQVEASKNSLTQAKRDYLPNVVLSAQQDYGTVNGQNGPLYGFGGYAVASSGLPLKVQNWNAGFGALYLANVNWEVYSFGRISGRIRAANAAVGIAQADLAQEQFQHQVRIAAAYLNALGSQRLAATQRKNLQRAQIIQTAIIARAKGGLAEGVDSAQANAEVAAAKIAFLRASDLQQEQEKNLAFLVGMTSETFGLDTAFVADLPAFNKPDTTESGIHPTIKYYQSRFALTNEQLKLGRASYYPSLNLVGIFQTRASGFSQTYAQDQSRYTSDYAAGIKPTISNYLLGVGLVWNLTTIAKVNAQVKSLRYSSLATETELQLAKDQLNTQSQIADSKFARALEMQEQAPIQVNSANIAYTQRSALYKNGLTNLVDVTTALYTLNRAESDRDLAYINVWQALLLKAAATGDLEIFTDQLTR